MEALNLHITFNISIANTNLCITLLTNFFYNGKWQRAAELSLWIIQLRINEVVCLERETRLELATPTLARSCSTNWAIPA